jgi:hypothetical protein
MKGPAPAIASYLRRFALSRQAHSARLACLTRNQNLNRTDARARTLIAPRLHMAQRSVKGLK